ncbi:MAG: leucine--tRNA ligase [Saccharofermentanales bacterium]
MKKFAYSKQTDLKWQDKWQETNLYRFDETKIAEKFYMLEMFSYPSGKTLHAGHWWNYGLSDSYGRFKRMQGYNVFHPPGFDAFGLPAENYAIKNVIHPSDSTKNNIATMEKQFRAMGTTYDWNYEIITCNEDYYKWTQWLFLQLFKKGLAYRKEAPVNWCPSCMTVLANEQAAAGKCERCDTDVVRRNMTQWFFKITDYAEELLYGLDNLDWPEKTKTIQKNWIGKSIGTEINFTCCDETITVFTTRADTLMGVTYLVLAPEHPLVDKLTSNNFLEQVAAYRDYTSRQSEIERTSTVKEKTGAFTGAYAVHPITNEKIPVWIADYVLQNYGTGAVMAVPAHDERDFDFAEKYNLSVTRVITDENKSPLPFCDDGVLIKAIGTGKQTVKYRLHDWLVSRQRYWGTPIPVIYCEECGIVPVPENELPVRLPYNVEFRSNGENPLATCSEFVNTYCPVCGKPAKRETDTLDTFVCSSWYFLRFYDNKNADAPFDKMRVEQIMPVDKYVGGIEHATMHLLYARFITKFLRDMGYLKFGEPFPSLFHQGFITGKDGKKMSKRDGAVSPDTLIEQYGSDVFRMHLGFGFSYIDGGPWNEDGIKAIVRFILKIGRLIDNFVDAKTDYLDHNDHNDRNVIKYKADEKMEYICNYTIKQVANNLESFSFNTAIARIMEFASAISDYQKEDKRNILYEEDLIKDLILLLAPLAPHLAEELWEYIGYPYSVHNQKFPACDELKLIRDSIEIAVQVNGNLREVISVDSDMDENEIKQKALSCPKVQMTIGERQIKKVIYVKGRVVNIVC